MDDVVKESSLATRVAPLAGALPPRCQQDVDSLNRFVRATVSGAAPVAPVAPDAVREVLLTGVTGFIGRFFLRELLRQNDELIVHCLVRADDPAHGHARIHKVMTEAEIWEDAFAARIRVVVGDICQPRFGLNAAAFEELCRRVDAVHHLAADINLVSSYTAISKVNTLSLRNVLELCLRERFKHLFHASTMGVFPEYFFRFEREFADSRIEHQTQPDPALMKKMFPLGMLGYPWSKLVTEQALTFAQQLGMPLALFRLPQTAMSSLGYIPARDLLVKFFAAVIECNMLPHGYSYRCNREAVNTLAQVCTAISLNPRRLYTIYHCCNTRPIHHDFKPEDQGLYLPEVPFETFKRACLNRGDKSPLHGYWAVFDHFRKYWFGGVSGKDKGQPVCDHALRADCPFPIKWPGMLTMLRRSKAWVTRNQQQWPYVIPRYRLDFDRLLARARGYADDLGVPFEQAYPEPTRLGLQCLVQALQAPEAGLLEDKLGDLVYEYSRVLHDVASFAAERQRHPEIEQVEMRQPVFIIGINRTGTTFLHRLLARDPRFWTLKVYELVQPTLPLDEYLRVADTADDPRRDHIQDILEASGMAEALTGIHSVDIEEPEEDFPLLRWSFTSWIFTIRYHVPDYVRYLETTGSRHAYGCHHALMQYFTWQRQQRGDTRQWLFKMPFHLMELEALMERYPDALFIQTHREPMYFLGSWMSLVERIRALPGEPRSKSELGAEQLALMRKMMARAVQFREAHPELEDRWMDVNYVDLVEDPQATVRRIYQRFGWDLDEAAVDAMETWRSQQSQQRRRHKRHSYDLSDYELTREQVNEAFKSYRDFVTRQGLRARS